MVSAACEVVVIAHIIIAPKSAADSLGTVSQGDCLQMRFESGQVEKIDALHSFDNVSNYYVRLLVGC